MALIRDMLNGNDTPVDIELVLTYSWLFTYDVVHVSGVILFIIQVNEDVFKLFSKVLSSHILMYPPGGTFTSPLTWNSQVVFLAFTRLDEDETWNDRVDEAVKVRLGWKVP